MDKETIFVARTVVSNEPYKCVTLSPGAGLWRVHPESAVRDSSGHARNAAPRFSSQLPNGEGRTLMVLATFVLKMAQAKARNWPLLSCLFQDRSPHGTSCAERGSEVFPATVRDRSIKNRCQGVPHSTRWNSKVSFPPEWKAT